MYWLQPLHFLFIFFAFKRNLTIKLKKKKIVFKKSWLSLYFENLYYVVIVIITMVNLFK